MNKERLNELISIALGAMSVVAIMASLIKNNFDIEEIFGSVVNFTQVAIPVLVILVATAIKLESKSFVHKGREALEILRKRYPEILIGPKHNRDNYDPEKSQNTEYLFIRHHDPRSKQKIKFIPVHPFEEGVLAIYIQKATLEYALKYTSQQATDEEIKKIQKEICDAVTNFIATKYTHQYEILENIKDDAAIIIDFNEKELGKKKFFKAVLESSETALLKLKSFQK